MRWILIACIVLTGCVSAEIKKSVSVLKQDFAVYKRAVIPNPRYDTTTTAAVDSLAEAFTKHLDELEALVK